MFFFQSVVAKNFRLSCEAEVKSNVFVCPREVRKLSDNSVGLTDRHHYLYRARAS